MDIKTLLHNLHDEVSCSVCLNAFTDPKILPCFHTFCLQCLNQLQQTSGTHGQITCPECRTKVQIPGSGDPKELPTNFRMNSLLDVMAIQNCNSTGVKCGNCDNTNAHSFYCFKCCIFWCKDCIGAHNIIRANKDHRVLAIKEFQDQDIEDVLKRPTFCEKKHHENEELKFFCKNCEVAICNTCVVTLHEGHAKVLLQDAASEQKLWMESTMESQKEKALQKRNKITRLQNECMKIQAQVAGVKRSAQCFVDNMIKLIEEKKRKLFKEVEDKAKESIESLEEEQSEQENELKQIETSIAETKTFLQRSTNAEIVQVKVAPDQDLAAVSDEAEQVNSDLRDLGHFFFVRNKALIDKTNSEGVGSLTQIISKTKSSNSSAGGKGIADVTIGLEARFILTTRNSENEQCYEEFDNVAVEIRNDQGQNCTTGAQIQDNKDGSYNISYIAKETGLCKVSVTVNGEHVRGSPFALEVKPRQYKPVLSFSGSTYGTFNRPWGVAANEHNEIAITDKKSNRVQIFSCDGTLLRSFGRRGSGEGEFKSPTGISFLNNGNIVVTDGSKHQLQLFTGQGEYLTKIGNQGNLDHQLDDPWGVSVDSDGHIIVADLKEIKIFTARGQFLRKFGKDFLIDPCHCIQKDQHLIVSDQGDHSIKVFDTEGTFLYKFGSKGEGDGEFSKPRCLAIDKAGHLMVCDYANDRVQVLGLNGRFITSIGQHRGRELGEFDGPMSVAVLTDGRIAVSDLLNHRIQIME